MILHHLHIIIPVEYIVLKLRHIRKRCFEKNKMQGNTLLVPILLVGLALPFLAVISSAKYNLVGRDDEIASMRVVVDKGISFIFVPIEKQILFLNGIRVCIFEHSLYLSCLTR